MSASQTKCRAMKQTNRRATQLTTRHCHYCCCYYCCCCCCYRCCCCSMNHATWDHLTSRTQFYRNNVGQSRIRSRLCQSRARGQTCRTQASRLLLAHKTTLDMSTGVVIPGLVITWRKRPQSHVVVCQNLRPTYHFMPPTVVVKEAPRPRMDVSSGTTSQG